MSDAVLLRVKLKSGTGTRLARRLPAIRERLNESGALATALRRAFQWVLTAEGLYTESVFLERTEEGDFVLWYMEAEDVRRFYDAFEEASDHPLAIAAEWVIRAFVEEPEKALTYAGGEGDFELLVHGTNPDRP